jgi:hypothetical protein
VRGIKSIFSVDELDNLVSGGSHSAIIFHLNIFQCFDESSLDITGVCSFDSSIDETFSTAHSMEVEFLWGKTSYIAVGHETLTLWTKVVFTEMRQ